MRVAVEGMDEYGDVVAGGGLRLGHGAHVVLDPAQDGEVVFVEMEDAFGHGSIVLEVATCCNLAKVANLRKVAAHY